VAAEMRAPVLEPTAPFPAISAVRAPRTTAYRIRRWRWRWLGGRRAVRMRTSQLEGGGMRREIAGWCGAAKRAVVGGP
jgi:hypothetical protein